MTDANLGRAVQDLQRIADRLAADQYPTTAARMEGDLRVIRAGFAAVKALCDEWAGQPGSIRAFCAADLRAALPYLTSDLSS